MQPSANIDLGSLVRQMLHEEPVADPRTAAEIFASRMDNTEWYSGPELYNRFQRRIHSATLRCYITELEDKGCIEVRYERRGRGNRERKLMRFRAPDEPRPLFRYTDACDGRALAECFNGYTYLQSKGATACRQ